MKIIVAVDSFKGSLSATKACEIISKAIKSVSPEAEIVLKPMADGGEGTAEAMIMACDGQWIPKKVTGPLEEIEVEAGYGWFEKEGAVLVEMACASGLMLLTKGQLNPLKTTTYGTGELIKKALEKKPEKIYLGIGGSATIDCGVGAAMALGWRFLDDTGASIGLGGGELEKIKKIIPPEQKLGCRIEILSDVKNPSVEQMEPQMFLGLKKVRTWRW